MCFSGLEVQGNYVPMKKKRTYVPPYLNCYPMESQLMITASPRGDYRRDTWIDSDATTGRADYDFDNWGNATTNGRNAYGSDSWSDPNTNGRSIYGSDNSGDWYQ